MNEIENTVWVTSLTIAEHHFCSHVKHSPTDTVYYIMYYLKQKAYQITTVNANNLNTCMSH